eukprot:117454-Chlamydomonas_euryale.AAC.1
MSFAAIQCVVIAHAIQRARAPTACAMSGLVLTARCRSPPTSSEYRLSANGSPSSLDRFVDGLNGVLRAFASDISNLLS